MILSYLANTGCHVSEKEIDLLENSDKNKSDRILAEIKKRGDLSKIEDVAEEKAMLVIFTLHRDYFAFHGNDIKEILPLENIAYVPGSPDYINGIINVRGDIESVLNIHRIMRLDETQITKDTRIIIAEKDGIRTGILVDTVEDVIEVSMGYIKPPISTLDKSVREFTIGGERIYADKYVSVLDVAKLFATIAPEKSN